jgi:transcriptional regulator with XRE-family HTH domain
MAKAVLSAMDQSIVEVVKRKRIENELSQKDLAFELEVSVSFIGDIENPKKRAKYNTNHLNKLAKIFKCSPRDFLPEKPF